VISIEIKKLRSVLGFAKKKKLLQEIRDKNIVDPILPSNILENIQDKERAISTFLEKANNKAKSKINRNDNTRSISKNPTFCL
jgi:hypothetical protein